MDNQKREDIFYATQQVDVPVIHREEYKVLDVKGNELVYKSDDGDQTIELPSEPELAEAVRNTFKAGDC